MNECYLCGEDTPEVIEDHHVIPRSIANGPVAEEADTEETVPLCANCHRKLHRKFLDPVEKFMSEKMKRREGTDGFQSASDLN